DMAIIRTGRASISILDHIRVDYYGTPTPLNQLGNLHVPEPSLITVQPWDVSQIGAIEKSIRAGNLGLNPANDGKLIRIPIPPLNLSPTFERSPDGAYPRGYSYSREDNPNRRALEECLAALEGGKEALAFSSGLAVVTALAQGLEPGDHIVAPDDVYYGLRKVIGEVFAKSGLEIAYVDMTNLESL